MTDTLDFMGSLQKMMVEEKGISESTAVQYIQTLKSLNGGNAFKNLAFLRKTDEVAKNISTLAPTTQYAYNSVAASVLQMINKPAYKKAYNHYKELTARENAPEKSDVKTETQQENWVDWEDVKKKMSWLNESVSSFALTKGKPLDAKQFDLFLKYIVLSLFTEIQPRRNQDYMKMMIVWKAPQEIVGGEPMNFYEVGTQRFIFNVYKTAKTHGQQVVDVPEALQERLAKWLQIHPGLGGKKMGPRSKVVVPLLVKSDNTPFTKVNSLTRVLNQIFGKNVGSSMLRHSYLTAKYGDKKMAAKKDREEMEADAKAMGHSVATQQNEYVKLDKAERTSGAPTA